MKNNDSAVPSCINCIGIHPDEVITTMTIMNRVHRPQKEIANQLCISEKTVKNHVSNIFKKIEVSDRTQAAVYAIKNNIVDIFK